MGKIKTEGKREFKLVAYSDNGILKIDTNAEGFTSQEIIGILYMKIDDIIDQLKGRVPMPVFNRARTL